MNIFKYWDFKKVAINKNGKDIIKYFYAGSNVSKEDALQKLELTLNDQI